jgi:para-nitrobenzyl esterase
MTAFKALLALCLPLIAAAVAAAPVRPMEGVSVSVATDAGRLQGREADGVRTFRGIPYAAAPVGALRWRPPQPPAPWSGTRPALKFGDDCLQHPLPVAIDPGSGQSMSEDCLYLNVWAPVGGARRLPVMVWIHGGGFVLGSGSLVASDGVVMVSLNYRLGRFGFFAHPALARDHPGDVTGNFGLMDQIAALKWVRRNIAAFGGDPARITIFGESAGGGSVLALMGSPMARGLFQGAIVESGGGRDRLATLETANHQSRAGYAAGAAFATKAGLKDPDAAQLRALPAATVLGDLGFLNNTNRDDYAGMVIDGRVVTADPAAIFARGGEAPVPLIIGFNSSELGALASVTGPWTNFEAGRFGPHEAALRGLYDPAGGESALRADFLSDLIFVEPARFLAAAHARNGHPAWLYQFGYVGEAHRAGAPGAGHASEIPYVFDTIGTVDAKASAQDHAMADSVSAYWAAFAKRGNPNEQGRPTWPRYNAAADTLLDFTAVGPAPLTGRSRARLDFLETYATSP